MRQVLKVANGLLGYITIILGVITISIALGAIVLFAIPVSLYHNFFGNED
jgi:hypothetical protein